MEPTAGAWSADEPTLDFSRLTAPHPRERGPADRRVAGVRSEFVAGESVSTPWNPLASVGAAVAAEVQSAAAALITAPTLGWEAPVPPAVAPSLVDAAAHAPADPAATAATEPNRTVQADVPLALPAADRATAANLASVQVAATPALVAARSPEPHGADSIATHDLVVVRTMQTVTLPAAEAASAVTREVAGKAYTSSTTTYGADGSVVSVDLYGFARTFDHVRLDYRPDGTIATRTLLDTENPAAAIVIDYDETGATIARHEIALPDRPYARVDILYDADGSVAERMRSGFASGDVASITVRFDPNGAIVEVEHRQLDGSRTIIGTSAANTLAGHGGDLLVGHGGADTFVLLDAGAQTMAIADFHQDQGDRLDLSHLLSGTGAHFVADAAFDGAAGAVRFDHVDAGVLVSVDLNGDSIADASILLAGLHAVAPPDVIL